MPLFWRAPLSLSLFVHILLASLFFLLPSAETKKGAPFVTRLVTPEELKEFDRGKPGGPVLKDVMPPARPFRQPRAAKPLPPQSRSYPSPERESRQVQPTLSPYDAEKPAAESGKGIPTMPGKGEEASATKKGSEEVSRDAPIDAGSKKVPPAPSLKERLFDREVIERFAKKEETKKDNTLTFDTEEFRYHTYMLRLKEKIENIWRYPPEAAARGIYGDLFIRFTIKKNGMLGDMELVRTSGHRSLDDAAQRALRDAQPFWPLPDEWGKEAVTITGHFIYSIYGTYIR